MENNSGIELAAWVQAIGSVLAILAAALIAIWQSRTQHQSAIILHKEERRSARIELSKTLLVLARNCAKAVVYISGQISDRGAFHKIAEGALPFDLNEIKRIDKAIESIPLHDLPDILVTHTMILSGTVRQFTNKVDNALSVHREMNAAAFEDLFQTFAEMKESLAKTCDDIESEVKRIESQK